MTARLPIVDSDSGDWGDVLNGFLLVAHNADGTHKSGTLSGIVTNVKDNGVVGDGSTNDTTALQTIITNAADGATIYFPAGTYRLDTLTLDGKDNVTFLGPSAILKRTNSVTNHLFRISETTTCTNLRFDIAEIDGNSFVGSATTGTAFDVRNTTGLIINTYIHHTWNHGIRFTTTGSSKVKIDLRAEFIGIGYTADSGFSASSPHGCGIYCATAAPLVDADLAIRGTDIKGFAAIYLGGCTRVVARLNVRRTGYRGLYCAGGPNNVTGLRIPFPVIEECGAVYESSATPGSSLYGEGTNAIYTGDSPTTAYDCVITGGLLRRTGENGIEGKFIATGVTVQETGYAYTSFGSGVAREGIYLENGSKVKNCTVINPGDYGIRAFSATTALSDLQIDSCEIVSPPTKGVSVQQSTTGTVTNVVIKNVTVRKGSASPTHGIHLAATGGASVGSSCVVQQTTTVGTFSTSAVLSDVSGGGSNTATVVGTTSV